MKNILCIISLAFALFSCTNNDDELLSKGYVQFDDIVAEKPEWFVVRTRAIDSDLNIVVFNDANQTVLSLPAGTANANEKYELDPGHYTLRAYSSNYTTLYGASELGAPKYYGEKPFEVKSGRTSYAGGRVPMTNAAFQLKLPMLFDQWFEGYTFTISHAGTQRTLAKGETLYLDVTDGDEFTYQLAAINTDGELLSQQNTINVSQGCLYCFTYDIDVNAVRSFVFGMHSE